MSAEEKNELLRKMANPGTYTTISEQEADVVENELQPNGYVKVESKMMGDRTRCRITEKGKEFIQFGGYVEIERMGKRERRKQSVIAYSTLACAIVTAIATTIGAVNSCLSFSPSSSPQPEPPAHYIAPCEDTLKKRTRP